MFNQIIESSERAKVRGKSGIISLGKYYSHYLNRVKSNLVDPVEMLYFVSGVYDIFSQQVDPIQCQIQDILFRPHLLFREVLGKPLMQIIF